MMASRVIYFVICVSLCGVRCGSIPTMPPQYDTIVIGLGSAGCTAASTLAQAGRHVLGLEAQDRVGGRVKTVPFGDGIVELGAEWIHGTEQSRVYELAMKNNVSIIPQNLDFEIYRSDGRVANRELVNELMNYGLQVIETEPPVKAEPLGQFITRKLMDYIAAKHPALLADTDFVQEFLHFMDLLVDNIEASNSWNDVTTDSKYEELGGNQHMSWHRNGYKTFFEILLNTYNTGPGYPNLEIKLNSEVTKITWPQDPSSPVVVETANGSSYTANNVIFTGSLGVLKESHKSLFSPALPRDKSAAIDNISIGLMDKIILSFDQAWWPKDPTFFAFVWNGDERKNVGAKDKWTTQMFGASTPLGSGLCLTLWTSGEDAKLVETLPEDVVKRKSMEVLRRFMGANRTIPEPTGIIRSNWYSNPFTRGSYSYDNLEMPKHPTARVELAQPLTDSSGLPRVLFAGEATNPTHFSTVHGAAESGYREAMRLLPASKI